MIIVGPPRSAAHVQSGPVVQQRVAGIHVEKNHRRLGLGSQVRHLVVNSNRRRSQRARDAALEFQVLAKQCGLPHPALHPHLVFVALPLAVGVDVGGGQVGEASVQSEVAEQTVGFHGRVSDVVQTAGHQQTQNGAANPAPAFGFVVRAVHLAGRSAEAQRDVVEPGPRDIQRTPGNHGKAQTRPCIHVNHGQAVARPAVKAVLANPADLRNVSHTRHQFGAAELTTPEIRHGGSRLTATGRRPL